MAQDRCMPSAMSATAFAVGWHDALADPFVPNDGLVKCGKRVDLSFGYERIGSRTMNFSQASLCDNICGLLYTRYGCSVCEAHRRLMLSANFEASTRNGRVPRNLSGTQDQKVMYLLGFQPARAIEAKTERNGSERFARCV